MSGEILRHGFAAAPAAVREAAEEAIELWGGVLRPDDGGFHLPVQAGLRRGQLRGRVTVEKASDGATLVLEVEDAAYHLHGSAVAILSLAGAAGVAIVLWPWFPRLLELLPVALVLAAGAWLLVLSRLQNRGTEELFATIDELLAHDEEPGATQRSAAHDLTGR